jgi:ribonuclease HI
MQITIYTDGACDIHADNKPGGWAAILVAADDNGKFLKETVLSGGQEMTTNNQMELTAVIEGLKSLTNPATVTVVSDSKYVINTVTKNFKINKNKILWQDYFKTADSHEIDWKFVKGHAGHTYNERCDKLAVKERIKFAKNPTTSQPKQQTMRVNTPLKIYLSTQYSGKKKSTAWSVIVTHDGDTQELSDFLSNTTELEGVLIGAIEALNHLETEDAVTLYTAQEYLSKGMNEWMSGWLKKDWKNNTKSPVKYQNRWKALLKLTQQQTIYFEFVKNRDGDPHFERGKLLTSLLIKRA